MARPKRQALCHPGLPHCAKGLCRPCYLRQYLPTWFRHHPRKATEYKQRWRRKYPRKDRAQRRRAHQRDRQDERQYMKWIHWRYHLSREIYEQRLADQQYACAICKAETFLVVDHNHATDTVRGLLCQDCNYGLGRFKDDIGRLLAAADYLTGIQASTEA